MIRLPVRLDRHAATGSSIQWTSRNAPGTTALACCVIRLLGFKPDLAEHHTMNTQPTSFKYTAARGALVMRASWLNSGIANALFAPVFTG